MKFLLFALLGFNIGLGALSIKEKKYDVLAIDLLAAAACLVAAQSSD